MTSAGQHAIDGLSATSRRIEPFATSVWPWVDEMAESNPEAVFFGGGVPPSDVIPLDRLRQGAERAWGLLGKKSGTLRQTAEHAVVEIDLGAPKGVVYRLLAGPSASKADTERLCKAIKAEGSYCRVVSYKS